jgi:hypothetical protein
MILPVCVSGPSVSSAILAMPKSTVVTERDTERELSSGGLHNEINNSGAPGISEQKTTRLNVLYKARALPEIEICTRGCILLTHPM